MSKKILIIGPAYPLRGGIAAFTERLAESYQNTGEDVEVISFKLQYPSILFPGKTQYAEGPGPKNIRIHSWINSINPFNWIKIGNRIKKMKPDLVIFKFWIPFMAPSLGTIGRIIKANNHTKVICVVDNIIPHESRSFDKTLATYFIKSMDGFIAMSDSVRKDIINLVPGIAVRLSPHPVYDHFGESCDKLKAAKKLKMDPKFKYILSFGLVRDYKGLDLLIKAMAADNVKSFNDLNVIVAGEFYSRKQYYLDLIEKLNLKDQFIIKDEFIKDADVGYYFSIADVIVQPYYTATQSGVTQIAYHFEKPMIVTNVGGLPEIVPDGRVGFVTEVNPLSVADAIAEFYKQDTEAFLPHIIEEKKKYSWEYLLESIHKLLSNEI